MKYHDLVQVYVELEATSKRLGKTHIIAEFLKTVREEDLEVIVLLLQGRVFQSYDERKIGVAARLVLKAIASGSGESAANVETKWKSLGDLGEVGKALLSKKKQATLFSQELTVKKVFTNLTKLASLEGIGTVKHKTALIAELLTSAKPDEAKFIIRTVLEEMRVGVADGTLRDAVTWAYFGKKLDLQYDAKEMSIDPKDRELYNEYLGLVQGAFDVRNNFGEVAWIAKSKGEKGLKAVGIKVFIPIKVMLGPKEKDVKSALERVGKPCQVEFKYDGFRIEAHKDKGRVELYTRRLEKVTKQFPEVVEYVSNNVKGESFILDAEAVGFDAKSGKYLPFQNVSQRIKRKYDIEKIAAKMPIELNVFDILYYNGENMINVEFKSRRALLEKIVKPVRKKIRLTESIVTSSSGEIEKFYKKSLEAGEEGLMLKNLGAPYKPGARVGHMVKLKTTMETFDLAIVGAEWGEGKRSKWLSSFTIACVDGGEFLEIGKVGTGIKEKAEEGLSFDELTRLLKPLIISEKGREVTVKPKVVVELNFEEIQKSPSYGSGYALRFPRVVRLREDKHVSDVSTLDMVEDAYDGQRK
ncbi:MAG: ATP-dependent DNA ligase [Candidatus Woesearchaeota archaeon]|nr:ATP-dependent DNA ligase [Candidatus Woesearchaeota archaeon]